MPPSSSAAPLPGQVEAAFSPAPTSSSPIRLIPTVPTMTSSSSSSTSPSVPPEQLQRQRDDDIDMAASTHPSSSLSPSSSPAEPTTLPSSPPTPSAHTSSSSPVLDTVTNLPITTGTYFHDPGNRGHDSQPAPIPAANPHTREAEERAEEAEAAHRAKKETAVAVSGGAGESGEEWKRLQTALEGGVTKAQLEGEWSVQGLEKLVDAASTEQLLTLLAALDDRRSTSRMTYHNLTFTRNGVEYLHNVSGAIEPGKLTALIGAPDSGITLLLSLLAGRPPLFGQMGGEILYDGQPISVATRRHVGYVVKEDPNLPQLTVYETLHFSARLRVETEGAKLLRFRTLLWMKLLGLSHTYNTVVGDALTRGVSGGERRRVSYGCEMIAGQSLVLADLPTNGLDSTSAFALIKNVTGLCRTGRAMLCSIVQPSPEILALFDAITVMAKGAVIYSGPPGEVERYFGGKGFVRPDAKSLPDWIEEMSATPERFWVSQVPQQLQVGVMKARRATAAVEAHGKAEGVVKAEEEAKESTAALSAPLSSSSTRSVHALATPAAMVPSPSTLELTKMATMKRVGSIQAAWQTVQSSFRAPAGYVHPSSTVRGQTWQHLTKAWEQSAEAAAIEAHLASLPRSPAPPLLTRVWNQYPRSFMYQFYVCLQRQAMLTFRNKGIWAGNLVQSVVMGLILGSLFLKISLSQEAVRVRFGLFFFMVLQSGMGTAQMIPVHFSYRSTFYNQKQNGYYSPAAEFLATYLVQLPIGAMETFIFSILVYPLAGLQDGIGARWAYLWLVLILINWVCRAWIMFLVSVSPTEAVTQVLQPISMLLFSTMSGFLAPRASIPKGWSWLYTISFFTYAVRGLAINEQYGLVYECDTGSCPYQTGYQVLALYDMQGPYSERWTDVENLVWFFIAFTCGTAFMYCAWQWSHTPVGEPPNYLDDETSGEREKSIKAIERAASHARSQHTVEHKAYIEWRELCYSVPIKSKETGEVEERLLLDHTFGWAQPNAMIALMGASGAGKSTLMDVLALKKNFAGQKISGVVLVNGVPQEPIAFSRIAGYVEQSDSHNPFSTIREAVEVSARLRLPTATSDEEVDKHVTRVLSTLGLTHLQDEIIGEAGGEAGVAPEVRKKVTIAVELITNPSLLFLDEPTTGLDAPGALSVMKAVKELAREIAVVCTIHQPSTEIVNMFDGLLLMKAGGQVAYFGPLDELPTYFEQQRLGEYEQGHNLGDFALACIKRAEQQKADLDGKKVDVAQLFLHSPQGQSVQARLSSGIVPEVERDRVHALPESDYPGLTRQVSVLTRRFFVSGYRDVNTFAARWITALFFAFMIGTLFVQLGYSQLDASNRIAAVFMAIMYAVFSAPVKAPARYAARPVYFREYGSRMYSAFSYWLSRLIADVPTILAEVAVFAVLAYFTAGLTLVSHGTHFALFLAILLTVRVMGLQWNEVVTGALADPAAGTALFAVSVIVSMLFSGFLIQKEFIPTGWIWMHYLSFIHYPLFFVVSNEMRDITQFTCDSSLLSAPTDSSCAIPDSQYVDGQPMACPIQCGAELLDQFGIPYGNGDMVLDYFVVVIFASVFTLLSYLVVRNINHVKR